MSWEPFWEAEICQIWQQVLILVPRAAACEADTLDKAAAVEQLLAAHSWPCGKHEGLTQSRK